MTTIRYACRAAKVQGGPGAAWHVLGAGKRLRELPITPDKLLQEGVIPEAPRLGTQGLMTSAMGLGCVAMSEFYP